MGKGGGGGGSAGEVDFPDYMKTCHGQWLNNGGSDTPTQSVTDLMNTVFSTASPYSTFTLPSMATIFGTPAATVSPYTSLTNLLAYEPGIAFTDATLVGVLNTVISDTVTALQTNVQYNLNADTIPRFKSGMANIGGALSSAIGIGEAVILGHLADQMSKVGKELHAKKIDILASMETIKANKYQQLAALSIEMGRIYASTAASFEKLEAEAGWKALTGKLEVYTYGCQVMASISGAAVSKGVDTPLSQSIIGGSLSGAAAGGMTGSAMGSAGMFGLTASAGPWGMAIGAGVGLLSALLQ